MAGLGIVVPEFADHVRHVFGVDATHALELGESPLGKQIEIVQQTGHRRIVPVGLLRLKRQTLAKRPGADAGRVEALDHPEDVLDARKRNTQPIGKIEQRHREISRLVNLVYQMAGNQQVLRFERETSLGKKVVAQRRCFGRHRIEIRPILETAVVPAGNAKLPVHPRPAIGDAVMMKSLRRQVNIKAGIGITRRRVEQGFGRDAAILLRRLGIRSAGLVALRFEQGVLLDFLRNERFDFEVRKRQQTDRLLQLRRHDQ